MKVTVDPHRASRWISVDNESSGLQDSAQSGLAPHAVAGSAEPEDTHGQPVVVARVGALAGGPDAHASSDEEDVVSARDERVRHVTPPSRVHVERLDAAHAVLALRVLIVLVGLVTAVVHGEPLDVQQLLSDVASFAP